MICVVVVELLLDDIFVVFLLLLFLLAVTRSGAIRHGLLVMGGVGCILLTWRRMGRGHERGMEGVRERLIILGIVHDFLEDYMIKAQRWSNALRAEGTIDVGNNNQTPWEHMPDAFAFPHAVPLRPCILRGKSQENAGWHCSSFVRSWTSVQAASCTDTAPTKSSRPRVSQICADGENSRQHSRRHPGSQ